MADTSVKVAVRVRPLSAGERAQGSESCVALDVHEEAAVTMGERRWAFDAALTPSIAQQDVYQSLVAPLVARFFDGFNATVFAYGQTGSGKTYTMGSDLKTSSALDDERGILPRVLDAVLERVHAAPATSTIVVRVSFLEILNEEIYDLLAGSTAIVTTTTTTGAGLSVRDEGKRGIVVVGLTEHSVESLAEVTTLLHTGTLQRATASTAMNANSSRSHAVCTLSMEQIDTVTTTRVVSKFHLVDLAGSERLKRTNAHGARFKEGVNINRGLLALGNVISALCERTLSAAASSTAAVHVPYRDSKLTRLLQDSLGGNSKTLMIACVSPADVDFDETASTLRYASRARRIQNHAVVNKETSGANEVASLKQQLAVLQLQLLQQQQQQPHHCTTGSHDTLDDNVRAELAVWKRVACAREEELQVVTSAKDKWKHVAVGLLSVPNSDSTSSLSSLQALAQEAMEFDKAIPVSLSASPSALSGSSSSSLAASKSSPEQLQAALDSFSDVLAEKEKIVQALASLSSSSSSSPSSLAAVEARLVGLTSSYEQKISELERRVKTLALEKTRLSLEMKASGGTADTASRQRSLDDVRAKRQTLQRQLEATQQARQECARLTGLLTTDAFTIATLEQEVADMTTQRVELQRMLKDAIGQHRREKREHELQLLQLTREDQRKQLELQRLSALHATQQHSALKRKTEEAIAANKRLRVMAATQQQQQKSRASLAVPSSSRTEYMDSVAAVLERTLVVQATIVGAKRAIAADVEARRRLALEIAALEARPSADNAEALVALKAALRDKSSEIRELQHKLASVERTNALSDELFPSTAASCHQIIRSLIDTAVENKAVNVALESATSAAEEQLVRERDEYEYAIEGLKSELRALSHRTGVTLDDTSFAFYFSAPSAGVVPRSAVTHSTELQQALEAAKAEMEALRAELETQAATKKKPPVRRKAVEIEDEIVSSSESDDSDGSDDDSDYVEHEAKKRRHRGATSRASVSAIATVVTPRRASGDVMDEIDDLLATPSHAGVPLRCSCSGKCATKACACKAERLACGSSCACNASKCHNRDGVERRKKSTATRKEATATSVTSVDALIVIGDNDDTDDSVQVAIRDGSERHRGSVATATTEAVDLTSQ